MTTAFNRASMAQAGDLRPTGETAAGPVGAVTGWPTLVSAVDADLREAAKARTPLTLLILAIDNLDEINREVGSRDADDVLGAVAVKLARAVRRRDRIIRYAGNRFAVLLRSCPVAEVGGVAERMARAVERTPVTTPHGSVRVRLRMGAAEVSDQAADAETVSRHARDALRAAKNAPGDRALVAHGSALNVARVRLVERQNDAIDPVQLLNEQRLMLAGQPIVSATDRSIAFHEALVRVRLAEGPIMGAAEAVPLAERHGVIPLFDYRVLQLAIDHLNRNPGTRLAINMSPLTLCDAGSWTAFTAHLGAHAALAERLIIELTETAAIEDPTGVRGRLAALKRLGVTIAIDDFGSGHTSFRHLRSFPVDILKIDGSFVANLAHSREDRYFTRMLVELAQHLGIETVAEWVGDEDTARTLTDWGVTYLQGDHIGPAQLWEVERPLARDRRRTKFGPVVQRHAS
ncbi:EAL domain-containing protein [Chelatococcus sp. GCM10030263]|uniref:EAL domain-containing protein n=1 Tax=Chelatococcus sp. GCM10030263 TaxID=3273387 RepID=UPI00361EEE19